MIAVAARAVELAAGRSSDRARFFAAMADGMALCRGG